MSLARRHRGIPYRYLPLETPGPDSVPRGSVRAPEALAYPKQPRNCLNSALTPCTFRHGAPECAQCRLILARAAKACLWKWREENGVVCFLCKVEGGWVMLQHHPFVSVPFLGTGSLQSLAYLWGQAPPHWVSKSNAFGGILQLCIYLLIYRTFIFFWSTARIRNALWLLKGWTRWSMRSFPI